MGSPSKTTPLTLWVWPRGMFPRRVLWYLKAKRLPRSLQSTLTVIPVAIDTKAGTLLSLDGYEAKPEGYSLPLLRITGDSGEQQFVTQSSSILEYFEELFTASSSSPSSSSSLSSTSSSLTAMQEYKPINLSGDTPELRAIIRDVVFLVNETFVWTNVYLRHATEVSRKWTGMTQEQQSEDAAADAKKQVVKCMESLERLMRLSRQPVSSSSPSSPAGTSSAQDCVSLVASEKTPNLADFNVGAARAYLEEMYGWNIFDGHDLLTAWFERYQKSEWWPAEEEMKAFADGDFSSLFV